MKFFEKRKEVRREGRREGGKKRGRKEEKRKERKEGDLVNKLKHLNKNKELGKGIQSLFHTEFPKSTN